MTEGIIGALIGAMITAGFTALGFVLNRIWDARDQRRASLRLHDLLWQLFRDLDEIGGGDFNTPPGLWYREELAEVLMTMAKRHHRVLGGAAVYRLARLAGGLRHFSIDPKADDGAVYSMDELIKDAGAVMLALLPKAFRNRRQREAEQARLEAQRRLMTLGTGHEKFSPFVPPDR